jgi:hypothetical protein
LASAVLALLVFAALGLPAGPGVSQAARVEGVAGSSLAIQTIDAPGHHFGFSHASVLAQATSATETAVAAQQTQIAGAPPGSTGTGACVTTVGGTCTINGSGTVTGIFVKNGSGVINVTAIAPPTAILNNGAPILFVPTTVGVESFTTCTAPTAAGGSVQCVGNTIGDALQGATVAVRFVTTEGFQDVAGTVTGPGQPLTQQAAIAQAQAIPGFTAGGTGGPCAATVGQGCNVAGNVVGSGSVTSSMTWRLTATVPAGAAAVGAGTPFAVFTTTVGVEALACAPVAAGATTATCNVTTRGNALQGSTVVVVFPGLAGAAGPAVTGRVTGLGAGALGAGLGGGLPLLPPPPLAPPPPLPVPPPPPFAGPASGLPLIVSVPEALAASGVLRAPAPEVPIIPEAETLVLVVGGLAALAGAARRRAWRGRRR